MVHLPHGGGRQPPGRPGAALGSWVATRGGESRRIYHLPHGGGRQPPGRPGAALGSWVATRGGESRRIYHLPHGGGRQPPGRPGAVLGSWVATRGGKSSRWYIFPMGAAGSRPAGPELSWGAGRPPGEGRAADGTSSPWRRPGAIRLARSCPGELGGHQGREEQPMVHLLHGGGRQPPGRPGAALGS